LQVKGCCKFLKESNGFTKVHSDGLCNTDFETIHQIGLNCFCTITYTKIS